MMLIRLNGASQTINVMSIPRDLQVQIPGGGQAKLNAAYSIGGPNLLIKTIRANVFPNLHVNHIIDVNFGSFEELVNAIGCVYTDVDHRYYNNTALTDYSSINIQPGYQKLCGASALAFVRFRHTDSDLVRNARQQDFIRWAKDQYGVDQHHQQQGPAAADLRGQHPDRRQSAHDRRTDQPVQPGRLLGRARHQADQVPGHSAVRMRQHRCQRTRHPVLPERDPERRSRPSSGPSCVPRPRPRQRGPRARARACVTTRRASRPPVSAPTPSMARAQAAALSKAGMPVYYPRLIDAGSNYCSDQTSLCPLEVPSPGSYPRHYLLRDQRGHPYPAYRMTLELNPVLGEYYGVQGTTWLHPPLLDHPSGTKVVAGKKLLLFAQGGKLIDVAWRTRGAVYWISNTLTTDIPNRKMVDIAASLVR